MKRAKDGDTSVQKNTDKPNENGSLGGDTEPVMAPDPVDLQILERATVLAYLRSGTGVGGNDEVARTIAWAIERGDHERYAAAASARKVPVVPPT